MRHAKRKSANIYQGVIRLPRQDGTKGKTLLLKQFKDKTGSQYYGCLKYAMDIGLAAVIVCGCVQGKEVCEIMTIEVAAKLGGHLE